MEERNGQIQEQERNVEHMHSLCKQHMYCHVTLTMQDGTKTHGIIYQVDHQNVYMFIPQDYAGHSGQYPSREEGSNDERIWGRPWGWGGWGWGRPWFRLPPYLYFLITAILSILILIIGKIHDQLQTLTQLVFFLLFQTKNKTLFTHEKHK
ncbi:hypothetical protein [Fictibacillus gelatini]|uniref:hypothetical protein n=1 Tax=Fictibacillus gelatini TaxID=225985 RepID=UPI00042840C6|nr:hypothetical protein [Fictibacillus gelatini]